MRASVIIPNHNGRRWLGACLDSLAALKSSSAPFEVIVVENASTDGTAEWLSEEWPEIQVVSLPSNMGYAGACNAGASCAAAPVLVFLNNDTVVRPGWLDALLAALEEASDVVIAGGLTLFLMHPGIVNSAGVRLAASGAGIDASYGEPASSVESRARDVAAVSGVSFAVKTDWFQAVGGFDEGFFMYYEDVDLCLRAWLLGRRVRFVPDSVVLHAFSATAGARTSPLKSRCVARNRLLIAFKCFEPRRLVVAVLLGLAQDSASVLALLVVGKVRLAVSVAFWKGRGLVDALLAVPRCLDARRTLQAARVRKDRDLIRLGLIDSPGTSISEFIKVRRATVHEIEVDRPARQHAD